MSLTAEKIASVSANSFFHFEKFMNSHSELLIRFEWGSVVPSSTARLSISDTH